MEPRVRALLPAVVAACVLAACGGSNGNGGDNPAPNPGRRQLAEPLRVRFRRAGRGPSGSTDLRKQHSARRAMSSTATRRWRVFDALWTHRQRIALRGERAAETIGRDTVDIGEIAVVQDEGDLIVPPNEFDLRNTGLRFTRNASGGYNVTRIDGTFRTALGRGSR